jgi:hypothetical protein
MPSRAERERTQQRRALRLLAAAPFVYSPTRRKA